MGHSITEASITGSYLKGEHRMEELLEEPHFAADTAIEGYDIAIASIVGESCPDRLTLL
jgi:hypothetical protein